MKVYDLLLWGIELLLLFNTHVSHKHFNLCFHFFIVLHYFFIVFFHACIVCFYLLIICFHLCIFSLKGRNIVLLNVDGRNWTTFVAFRNHAVFSTESVCHTCIHHVATAANADTYVEHSVFVCVMSYP